MTKTKTKPLKIEEMGVSDLKHNERNPRLNDHAVQAVARSIEAFGFNNPILIRDDLTIVAGHTRHKAAIALGLATVPCVRLSHLDETQAKAYNIADNRTGEIAEWDEIILEDILRELAGEEELLNALGMEAGEIDEILKEQKEEKEETLRPYKKVYVLISFSPERLVEVQEKLEEIIIIDGVEYEMSAN